MRIFKNAVVVALVLFLGVHIACTVLYVLPDNLVPVSLRQKSKRYIAPLFDQGWALFAPVPEVNKKVYVSCSHDGKQWSGWEAVLNEYVPIHQSNRMSGSGKVVLSVSSTLHFLYSENADELKLKKNIVGNNSSGYFKVLKQAIENKLMWQYKENKNLRVLVIYTTADCAQPQTYSIYYP
jgi:hypothetical protein